MALKEEKMKKLFNILSIFFILGFAVNGALAQAPIKPGGPWLTENQQVNYTALADYEELTKALKQIEKTSKGLMVLESIGLTNMNRDIWMAKIGDPKKEPVMIITQQHGDEPIGTEAAVEVIKYLSTGSAQAKKILDSIYVLIVARVNPDGAELWQRYNHDPAAPPAKTADYLYTRAGVGWDINRYNFIDWTTSPLYAKYLSDPVKYPYPTNPVPEAVAVAGTFAKYQPLWIVDFHGQGTYVTNEGENVTNSILWPTAPGVPAGAVTLSKQICAAMMNYLEQYGYATLSLYPGGPEPGIARNAYGLAGAGSVLSEFKGGIGQKSLGMLVKHAANSMMAILQATADSSLFTLDTERVEDLPVERIFYYKELPPNEEIEPE